MAEDAMVYIQNAKMERPGKWRDPKVLAMTVAQNYDHSFVAHCSIATTSSNANHARPLQHKSTFQGIYIKTSLEKHTRTTLAQARSIQHVQLQLQPDHNQE